MSDFKQRLAKIIGDQRIQEIEKEAFIAAQIIKNRHKMNMSQQDLATAIGVSKSTIGRIEAGITKNPGTKILMDISRVLDTQFIIDGRNQRNKALV